MLSTRGLCFICRVQRSGVERNIPLFQTPRKFSSLAREVNRARSGRAIQQIQSPKVTPKTLWSTPIRTATRNRILAGYVPQIRFQSTLQNVSEAAHNVLGDPGPSSANSQDMVPFEAVGGLAPGADQVWRIGALKEWGLDFGWGPTSMMQWIFEHIYVMGGFSFGTSLVLLAAFWRIGVFPLTVQASEQAARMQKIKPHMESFQKRYRAAMAKEDQVEVLKARRDFQELRKTHGIQTSKLLGPFVQMPLGFGSWRLIRNMAWLPAPGMATGGFLWFPNLILHDPFFVLPLSTCLFQHLSVRFGSNPQMTANPLLYNVMLWGMPGLMFMVMAQAPAGVQLTFCTGSLLAMLSNIVMRNERFRSTFGLTPRDQPPEPPKGQQYKGVITVEQNLRDKALGKVKKVEVETPLPPNASFTQRMKHMFQRYTPRALAKRLVSSRSEMSNLGGSTMMETNARAEKYAKRKAAERDNELARKRNKEREELKKKLKQRH